ncbi:hypothetical protein [Streptomyces sp. NBC_01006]|uniref:hypothetical protein n=1 Tax=Streptomyces sp. NBC_01006 TaxID=2903716 RepID=UPI00386E1933|nr:hypothetical protein OG509_32145 [Streptomyces sp. NBC_01006]
MRHWPLTGLQLTTAELVLRLPSDELDALAQVAADGVVPDDAVYFPQPWPSAISQTYQELCGSMTTP